MVYIFGSSMLLRKKRPKKVPILMAEGENMAAGHGGCHEINTGVEQVCKMGMQKQIMVDHPDLMLCTPDDLLRHWVELRLMTSVNPSSVLGPD